ncbi:MAG: hypothetical protein K9J06_00080 [Flavobacteriales bacterium]|nr:hypothetical protein [Flavobacteriales bacterium]
MQKALCILLMILAHSLAVAQDSTGVWTSSSWRPINYGQEGRIYNRIHHFFESNPALAGFDRRLNVRYGFMAEKLSLGYYASDGTYRHAFQEHRVAIDGPFGIRSDRWGTGLAYVRRQEGRHILQQVYFAHSGRIDMGQHHIILGGGLQWNLGEFDQDNLLWPEMIDPRYGAIYQSTHGRYHSDLNRIGFKLGTRYYWQRLRFDYDFRYGPDDPFAFAGMPTTLWFHHFVTAYHFKVDDDFTLSPEIMVHNNELERWFASGFLSITYRDAAYFQLGLADHNRMTFALGGQIKSWVTLQAGSSIYTDPVMAEIAGAATVEVRLWFHWDYFKRKKG